MFRKIHKLASKVNFSSYYFKLYHLYEVENYNSEADTKVCLDISNISHVGFYLVVFFRFVGVFWVDLF